MSALWSIATILLLVYCLFLFWYGGNGKPLTAEESARYLAELSARTQSAQSQAALADVQQLIANDDGKEFVMQNLARYRPKALYPAGFRFDDDPRAADRRYGKAIILPLLRFANVPIFIARRSGSFIEPDGADAWHYVAMVRYRSRRDFLRFALLAEHDNITVHKWAALEKTHVFPVKPLISLVFVRGAVGLFLAIVGALLYGLIG